MLIYICAILCILFFIHINRSRSSIVFCNHQEVKRIFSSPAFNYHTLFNEKESRARTKSESVYIAENSYSEIRQFYCDAGLDFEETDRKNIRSFIRKYPLLNEISWKFIQLPDSIDFGFPFTVGDAVVLPESLVKRFCPSQSHTHRSLFKTLIHESIHITQRAHPDVFRDFYQNTWNYVYAPDLKIPSSIRQSWVVNPDGFDNYVIGIPSKGHFYYALMLDDDSELTTRAYKVVAGSNGLRVDDSSWYPLREFSRYHFDIESCYHPNEIFAYLMSDRLTRAHW